MRLLGRCPHWPAPFLVRDLNTQVQHSARAMPIDRICPESTAELTITVNTSRHTVG